MASSPTRPSSPIQTSTAVLPVSPLLMRAECIQTAIGAIGVIGEVLKELSMAENNAGSEDVLDGWWNDRVKGGLYSAVERLSYDIAVDAEYLVETLKKADPS